MIIDAVVTLGTNEVEATATNDISVTVNLNDTIENPSATFCEKVDECLGISPSGDATKFLNEKGEWVVVSGGGNYNFFNGLTVDDTDVVLGGEITQDTELWIDAGLEDGYNLQIGLLPNGIQNVGYGSNKSIFTGLRSATAAANSMLAGHWQTVTDSGVIFSGMGYTDNQSGLSSRATIECAFRSDTGETVVEIETNNRALQLFPDKLVWSNYQISGGPWLDLDTDAGYYRIGDINSANNGYFLDIDDENQVHTFNSGGAVNQIDGSFYFGDRNTDGSWRIALDSGNLVIEKRVSGSWVTKQTLI